MTTESTQDELRLFHDFLGRRIQNGGASITPEESVREFRIYQDELARFRQTIAASRAQAARGEAKPLDVDALMERVNKRLAAQNAK